jgi:hypothetical protein
MTTSNETDWMDHPKIRALVDSANALTVEERMTLMKGLIPSIARELSSSDFAAFARELDLKGQRYHEAVEHHGEGRAERKVPGEREIEAR